MAKRKLPHPVEPDVLSFNEVAERLGVNVWTLYRTRGTADQPFPVLRVGRRFFVSRAAFTEILARGNVVVGQQT